MTASHKALKWSASPAAGSGRWDDLMSMFGRSAAVFCILSGPEHVLEAANPAFFAAIGSDRARTGVPIAEVMPGLAEQGFVALMDDIYRTGRAYTAADTRVMRVVGDSSREAFFDFTCEPQRDDAGEVVGITVVGVETTQGKNAQRLTAEHRALLEQIARDQPLEQILEGMALILEEQSPDLIVSVLLADPDGAHLRHGTGPSLPDFYNEAIDGISVGEGVGSCGTAAYRREPVIATDIGTDPDWRDFRDVAEAAGVAACWSTPILGTDGVLLGTFAMYHRRPCLPQDVDLALSAAFTRTAALAIERHRVQQARAAAEAKERAARHDLAFILEASTELARDLDVDETLHHLARLAVPALAPMCVVDVICTGRIVRAATAAGTKAQEDLLAAWSPVEEKTMARLLARGITEVIQSPPTVPGPWRRLGVTGHLCVPLVDRGRVLGALTLLATDERPLDDRSVALAQELALRAAATATNAYQYTQRVQLAHDLQAGLLLPDLPEPPGATVASCYEPAGEGLEIGGDFYDLFRLDDDRWAFMIGDVCGRGAVAATMTGLVRHTVRAVARLRCDLVAIADAVNTALIERSAQHELSFVTLVYGELRPSAGRLNVELIRAGHLPPLHRRADGTVEALHIPGMLLGAGPDPDIEPHKLVLESGESLVMVTDGFTEARSPDGDLFGDERLVAALTARGPGELTAQDALDAITDGLGAFIAGCDDSDDDRAALVITAT
ncbi:SpoIIE family protein phosphatase [Actinoallomurus sp. CA-150999]|uniref:SpoIIE family protein phosphatase n=1 Tax=Actinoallomurus sp. CA-150999 TaxID=3239887 RepID=UPI003D9329F9